MDEKVALMETYLKDVENIDPISDEEKEELITRLIDGDDEVVEDLMHSTLCHIAERAEEYKDQNVHFLDLIQSANLAVNESLYDFDGDPSTFDEYVDDVITEALENAVEEQRKADKISQKLVDQLNRLDETVTALTEKLGRPPEIDEIAEAMEISQDEVSMLLKTSLDAL